MMNNRELYLGIDLGTTNTAAATARVKNGKLQAVPMGINRFTDLNSGGGCSRDMKDTLPSCVTYYRDKTGSYIPIVGDAAKKVSYTQPYAVAVSVKSQMGQPKLTYPDWKEQYPDQTPQEVSGRILKHVLEAAAKAACGEVRDAVITVPASYGVAQRRATLMAAELAGLRVLDESGEYRDDILLPEPEAVIYAVLNEDANGEIDLREDFAEPKLVMVYDIGGGTLDITLHRVSRSPDSPDSLVIRGIATNRYSTVAGNTMDKLLAERIYRQYVEELEQVSPGAAKRIRDERGRAMAYICRYAEEVKEKISNLYCQYEDCGGRMPEDEDVDYGGEMPSGYNLEQYMSRREFEDCLEPLMGRQYAYEDYKRFASLPEEENILYPVLDVLAKGAEKLGEDDLKVDMVILNGGMSRLYLIRDRLNAFFGFPMTTVSDPDRSVAKGAAVYHYYLKQNKALPPASGFIEEDREQAELPKRKPFRDMTEQKAPSREVVRQIRTESSVLSETIYLGLKGGATRELVRAGQDIPFLSETISGFGLEEGADRLRIPIMEKRGNGYVTVARGEIQFGKPFSSPMPISIQFALNRSGSLSFKARSGNGRVGSTNILLGGEEPYPLSCRRRRGKALIPPDGAELVPSNELSSLMSLLRQMARKNGGHKSKTAKKVRQIKKGILTCSNPEDFSTGLLKHLRDEYNSTVTQNLLPLARKLSGAWTEEERGELLAFCRMWLKNDLAFYSARGDRISANAEAVKTYGVCGTAEDCLELVPLCGRSQYTNALLYAFGASGANCEWVFDQFKAALRGKQPVQDSLQALGLSIYNRQEEAPLEDIDEMRDAVMTLIESGDLRKNVLHIAVVTLGLICAGGSSSAQDEAVGVLDSLRSIYSDGELIGSARSVQIARSLICGDELEESDERFLLELLDMEAA